MLDSKFVVPKAQLRLFTQYLSNMPNIELVPVRMYQPNEPYNSEIDNRPLSDLIDRILLVNSQVDIDADTLRDSIGSVGTLANRLAKSLNDDGSLKTAAIDATNHSIANHIDGQITISNVTYSYVRMTSDERDKLSFIADNATNLTVMFDLDSIPSQIPSNISVVSVADVVFDNDLLHFKKSDSITWRIDTSGAILADTNFPASVRHNHFYDMTPTHQNIVTPDYTNYLVTSIGTPYKEQTLRVTINGISLSETDSVYVPYNFTITGPSWKLITYTEDTATDGIVSSGKFSLSTPITADDIIRVNFDTQYT